MVATLETASPKNGHSGVPETILYEVANQQQLEQAVKDLIFYAGVARMRGKTVLVEITVPK